MIVTVQTRIVYIIRTKSERMLITMTVNLTLNEITVSEASKILELIKRSDETLNISSASIMQPQRNTSVVPTVPVQQAVPVQVPTTPVVPIQQTVAPVVPVQQLSAQNYTIEQLQAAIAPLLDAGKVGQIQALVQSFGVNTLMDIPPARYGEFANGLRNLGGVL